MGSAAGRSGHTSKAIAVIDETAMRQGATSVNARVVSRALVAPNRVSRGRRDRRKSGSQLGTQSPPPHWERGNLCRDIPRHESRRHLRGDVVDARQPNPV